MMADNVSSLPEFTQRRTQSMNTFDDSMLPDLSIKSRNFKAESKFVDIKRPITKLYDSSSGVIPVWIILMSINKQSFT